MICGNLDEVEICKVIINNESYTVADPTLSENFHVHRLPSERSRAP